MCGKQYIGSHQINFQDILSSSYACAPKKICLISMLFRITTPDQIKQRRGQLQKMTEKNGMVSILYCSTGFETF